MATATTGPAGLHHRRRGRRHPGPRDAPRIRVGALVSATSALALLVIMFAMEWYGVAGVPDPSAVRPAVSTAENGWHGLTVTRWVLLATIVASIGAVVLHASQRQHGNKTDTSLIVAALGALSSVLLIYRVLIVLPAASAGDRPEARRLPRAAVRAGDRVGRLRGDPRAARPRARCRRGPRTGAGRTFPRDAPACSLSVTSGKEISEEGVVVWRTDRSHSTIGDQSIGGAS